MRTKATHYGRGAKPTPENPAMDQEMQQVGDMAKYVAFGHEPHPSDKRRYHGRGT